MLSRSAAKWLNRRADAKNRAGCKPNRKGEEGRRVCRVVRPMHTGMRRQVPDKTIRLVRNSIVRQTVLSFEVHSTGPLPRAPKAKRAHQRECQPPTVQSETPADMGGYRFDSSVVSWCLDLPQKQG